MSTEVWYYELLTKSAIIGKSKVYHPHFDVSMNKFLKSDGGDGNRSDNESIITENKCVLEFYKPLITNYRSFVKNNNTQGFTLKELCHCISSEWSKIKTLYSEWIDNSINNNIIDELYLYTGENDITRVLVNFNVPIERGVIENRINIQPFVISNPSLIKNSDVHLEPTVKAPRHTLPAVTSVVTSAVTSAAPPKKTTPLKAPKKKRKTTNKKVVHESNEESGDNNNDTLAKDIISNLLKGKRGKTPPSKKAKTDVGDLMSKYDK